MSSLASEESDEDILEQYRERLDGKTVNKQRRAGVDIKTVDKRRPGEL